MRNRIPLIRGLGSSAAATVAGVVAANALADGNLAPTDMLRMATAIEGHPDNVGAALLGGFVVSTALDGAVEALRFDVPRDLRCVLYIPELRLETAAMRAALPKTVPFDDAATNLARVALGVAGMAGRRTDLLRYLTIDRLHEPYRAEVYPQLPRLVEAARDGRRARRLPVRLGLGDHRVHRHGRGGRPDRGGVLGRRGRHRPARAGDGRRPRGTPARRWSTGADRADPLRLQGAGYRRACRAPEHRSASAFTA